MFWFILGEFTRFLKQTNKTWSSAAQMIEKNPLRRIQNPGCHGGFFFPRQCPEPATCRSRIAGALINFSYIYNFLMEISFSLGQTTVLVAHVAHAMHTKRCSAPKGMPVKYVCRKDLTPFCSLPSDFLINVWNQVILIMARCVRRWGIFSMVMRKLYKVAAGMIEEERCKCVKSRGNPMRKSLCMKRQLQSVNSKRKRGGCTQISPT